MYYEELYKESNELAAERFELVMERIGEIAKETDVEGKEQSLKRTFRNKLQN